MKKRIIQYYLNETAFRGGCPAYNRNDTRRSQLCRQYCAKQNPAL